jgi:hypothetical protein
MDTLDAGNCSDCFPESAFLRMRDQSLQRDYAVFRVHLNLVRMRDYMPHPGAHALDQDLVRYGLLLGKRGHCFGSEAAHPIQKIFGALRHPVFVPPDEAGELRDQTAAPDTAAFRVAEIHQPRSRAESRGQNQNVFRDAVVRRTG